MVFKKCVIPKIKKWGDVIIAASIPIKKLPFYFFYVLKTDNRNGIFVGSVVILNSNAIDRTFQTQNRKKIVLLSIDVAETTITQPVAKILTFALSVRWRPE